MRDCLTAGCTRKVRHRGLCVPCFNYLRDAGRLEEVALPARPAVAAHALKHEPPPAERARIAAEIAALRARPARRRLADPSRLALILRGAA